MNQAALKEICEYIYNDLPRDCWGSPEIVAAWFEKFNIVRESGNIPESIDDDGFIAIYLVK